MRRGCEARIDLTQGLELTVLIPLVETLQVRVGGKVQTFGDNLIGGFNAGLGFTL